MLYVKKSIFVFIIILLMVVCFFAGCSHIDNPLIPEINPNPTVNPENSTVSYIKVGALLFTIKVNQSIELVLKG